MHSRSSVRILALVGALAGSGCGAIWGFEDPLPLSHEGGTGPEDTGVDRDGQARTDSTTMQPEAGGDLDTGHAEAEASHDASDGGPSMTCVPMVPSGWQGPLILAEQTGTPLPTPPECPATYEAAPVYDGNAMLEAPPAMCSCACGAASGVTCTPPTISFFGDNACTMACGSQDQTVPTTGCGSYDVAGCRAFTLSASTPTGGSCQAMPGATTLPMWSWSAAARLCAPISTSDAGCTSGRLATPTTSAPFEPANYCVMKAGGEACPSTYPAQRTYYASATDTRACTCSCGSPGGAACMGTVTTADVAMNCTGGTHTFPAPTTCTPGAQAGATFAASPATGGSCMESSEATGGVTEASPTTVCCLM